MKVLENVKAVAEYLEGAREEPPPVLTAISSPWFRGLWWGFLVAAILLFCGQSSKFIYIDF